MLKDKIIIVGCPGSGKSVFARKLFEKTKIPLYHLDNIYWKSDWTHVPRAEFKSIVNDIMKRDKWIIDGNYGSTMEERIRKCETIFFLDYTLDVCLQGVKERLGKEREDMPCIEVNEDEDFIKFIENYPIDNRPKVMKLLQKYSDKEIIIFNSREEANKYINHL